jgi:hypothetical protein
MTWAVAHSQIGEGDGSSKLVAWTGGVTADGAGPAVEFPEWADNCVQIIGTISGATIVVEGSNDGTNYNTLNNAQGAALSFTSLADSMKQIVERPRYIRPKITGGTATGIGVYIVMRRPTGMRT